MTKTILKPIGTTFDSIRPRRRKGSSVTRISRLIKQPTTANKRVPIRTDSSLSTTSIRSQYDPQLPLISIPVHTSAHLSDFWSEQREEKNKKKKTFTNDSTYRKVSALKIANNGLDLKIRPPDRTRSSSFFFPSFFSIKLQIKVRFFV